jgi:hypothetical protein
MAAWLSRPFIASLGQKTSCELAPSRQHVGVAKLIVNNNPETMKSGQRSAPALKGCVRPACMVVASGQQKSPGARFARAAWRSFGEYAFLEDSRYASQRKK